MITSIWVIGEFPAVRPSGRGHPHQRAVKRSRGHGVARQQEVQREDCAGVPRPHGSGHVPPETARLPAAAGPGRGDQVGRPAHPAEKFLRVRYSHRQGAKRDPAAAQTARHGDRQPARGPGVPATSWRRPPQPTAAAPTTAAT
ncbi:hypothetical protein EGW08_018848 [Elysia chlorotica]|uniref:Uncharacterized protein n=1 Tax=Elysia chlorotica TaxID=188477 RepID=A0A433SVQ0_ELYCH|nr:hypothetical protein EGW08_018848 [Elysia chlorotica]